MSMDCSYNRKHIQHQIELKAQQIWYLSERNYLGKAAKKTLSAINKGYTFYNAGSLYSPAEVGVGVGVTVVGVGTKRKNDKNNKIQQIKKK